MNLDRLRRIVEESDTAAGRTFDIVIQLLIITSIVCFSIETLPGISPEAEFTLNGIEVGCVAAFTVEYLLRLLVARQRLGFVFSFFGLVDLLAILPFYLTMAIDLRAIRVLRLLRLLRILKLARYSAALRRFRTALVVAHEELALFFLASCALLFLAATGIYYFENQAQPETFKSIFHSLWWAVTTLTTVGYGDAYPITTGGRIFTFFILLIGLGVISVPTGIISAALSSVRRQEEAQRSGNARQPLHSEGAETPGSADQDMDGS